MAEDPQRPIVVRRPKKRASAHHGGAWKIAYADFVTAMMAFFLIMWLLGSTAKGDLQGIQEYFRTPLKVALSGGSGSGDSSHVINGGGKDLTRSEGQVMRGQLEADRRIVNIKAAKEELARRERARFLEIKARVEKAVDASAVLRQYREQLMIDITDEGLRVQIIDSLNRPMFAVGSAALQPYAKELLFEIGRALNDVENKITVSGHTDASPYASGEKGYSNWELSADRANASRRVLVAGGMDESRLLRVLGMAAAAPLDRNDPLNPMNRRISLIVMNKQAEEALDKMGQPASEPRAPEVAQERPAAGAS